MNINFFLRKSSIWYDITWAGNRIKRSLKIKCQPNDWIEKNKKRTVQRAKDPEINFIIDDFEAKVNTIFNDFRYKGIIAPSVEQIQEKIEGKQNKKKVDFFSVYDEFLEAKEPEVKHNTYRHYKSFKNILTKFVEDTGYNLDFHNCDLTFYDKFRKYRYGNGICINTFGHKDIKFIKAFLEWATWRDYPVNRIYKRFEKPTQQQEVKALTEDELLNLYNKKQQKNLDIFLFLCSTLMHISDYNRFAKEGSNWFREVYFQGVKKTVIYFKRQKTGKDCFVPFEDSLHFRPVELYNKYKGNMPPVSGQKLNEWLKNNIGGITSKAGRKTGATQWIRNGMNMEAVMKIGGWQTESSLRSYLGFNVEDLLRESGEKSKYMKVV